MIWRKPRRLALCLLGVSCLTGLVFAQTDFPKIKGRVNDFSGILSSAARNSLEQKLAQFEKETTNQIAVAILPSIHGESLEGYSIKLAESWKLGKKDRDNGVLLLIVQNERAVRIEVGYGLEGALTDVLSHSIISNEIIPAFRAGRFDDGIIAGLEAIMSAIRGEYQPEEASSAGIEKDFLYLSYAISIMAGFFLLIDLIRYRFYLSKIGQAEDRYSLLEWFLIFSILLFLIKFIIKLIINSRVSSSGGYYGNNSGYGSFGSSGGFSGGGGGFGGGGASGRW